MPTTSKKINFYESEEGAEIKKILMGMTEDVAFNTDSSYSADTARYADNRISFVDKHMRYLSAHPMINPRQYISNLRLMTRLK